MTRFRSALLVALPLAALSLAIGCSAGRVAEERSPGEIVFRASCQNCHRLPKARTQTDEEWPTLVNRYGQRAGLTSYNMELIIEYLTSVN